MAKTIDMPITFVDMPGYTPRAYRAPLARLQLPASVWEAPAVATAESFAKQIGNSFWKGWRFASEGAYWGMPLVAIEAATAKRGEMVPTIAAQSISLAMQPIASGVAAATLTATLGLPPVAAAVAGMLLVGYASAELEHTLTHRLSAISQAGELANRTRFGAGFLDTRTAQQRRQRAATELAGALPTSRRWLGQEAVFLHK